MHETCAETGVTEGFALLERAITYTLGELRQVTPDALTRPTPCPDWNLRDLLLHMYDSLTAIDEALELGRVDRWPTTAGADAQVDPVVRLRNGAHRLLGASARCSPSGPVLVADQSLTSALVLGAGAVEIAVHGWDLAQASGHGRPIPAELAADLLPLAAVLVGPADRPARFAPPVAVPAEASPDAKLIAFVGRQPAWGRLV